VRMAQSALVQGKQGNTGRVIPCMGSTNKTLDFHWTPRVLKVGRTIHLTYDITIPETFSHGVICSYLWLDDYEDPIYENCNLQQCIQFLSAGIPLFPDLTCPVPKGYRSTETLPFKIAPTTPLPAGKFRGKSVIKNQDDKFILCLEFEIEVEDDE